MTLSLLLALLGPIAQSQAAPPAASDTATDAVAGRPLPSVEPEPEELPVDDPYASDDALPSEEAPSDYAAPSEDAPSYDTNITIYKWLCPSGYDYTDPESRPDEDCTEPLDGIPFELSSSDSGSVTSTTGDYGSGQAQFFDFPAGSYDLTEVSSPYGMDGFRVCNDFGYGQPGAEPATVGQPFSFEVPADQSFNGFCDWYNVPSGNSITIYKWLCPSGYDYRDQNADPQYDCTEALDGIEFTLYDQSSSQTTATTGDESSGQVVYDGLDSGDYQIAETNSDDPYDSYIIRCYTGNQDWLGDYESHGIDDQYGYSFQDGQYVDIYCNWYDIPGGNSITIYKWLCPAGYDYEGQGGDPLSQCTEALDGIEFTLYGPEDSDETTATTGDDDPGQVVYDGLDPGDYEIAETDSPDPYSSYIIRCYTGEQEWLADYATYDLDERYQYTFDDQAYVQLYCNWYDIPSYNSVTIYKWLCPSGYDYSAYQADAETDCTEALDGIEFTLSGDSGDTTATTGDDDPGQVTFDDLDPGDYSVAESSSGSYDSYVIRCYTGDHEWLADYASYGLDESYPYSFEDGDYVQIFCNWYDIPGGNSITIYKWLCPSGYEYSDFGSDPASECTEALDGIEFTLAGPTDDQTTSATTGDVDSGTVTFDGLDPGGYQITETDSGSYDNYVIRCYVGEQQYTDDYRSYPIDNAYGYTFDEGEYVQLYCNWYDIPGGNTITIYKWLCPYQYDYTDPESRPDEDCTEALDGVDFELTPVGLNTTSVTATTGDPDPGIARFSGFEPGTYDLTETTTTYGTDGFRVCNDFGFGNPGAESATVGEPFEFEVPTDAPFNGVCNWYNVPSTVTTDDTDNVITIYKWLCPSDYDYSAEGSDPLTDCTEALDGIDFTLTGPEDGDSTTATTGDPTSGQVSFGPLDAGDYAVSESASGAYDGYVIRCYTGNQQWLADYTSYGLDYAYPFSFVEGQYLNIFCNWYDIPTGYSITIYKWLCPAYYDYAAEGSNPESDCTEAVDGVDYTLYGPGATDSLVATTGDVTPGLVDFDGLSPGSYEVAETYAEGYYDSYVIRCFTGNDDPLFDYTSYEVGSRLPLSFDDGVQYIYCDWYNVPGGNTVTVYKWLCPYDYDYSAYLANPVLDCTQWVDGIDFSLTPTEGEAITQTTGSDGPGWTTFSDLDPGSWSLAETASPYQSGGFVRCYNVDDEPGDYGLIDTGDEYPIDFPADGSYHIVCDWYNLPYDNSITIYKWNCPYGYEYPTDSADPYTDCTEVSSGIEFTASNLESTYTGATGDDGPGRLVFDGLTPGTWNVEETVPTGYSGVITADCYEQGDEPNPAYGYGEGIWDSEVDIPTEGSTHWVCNWFNLYADDPGDVVIYKWTCPEGYDIYGYGANAAYDCTQATNGVQYTADGPDYSAQSSTGDTLDGAVIFEGLEPADYTFTETLPSDTLYVFIADCTGTSVDVVHPYPLYVGNPLVVRVNPGDRIVCNWYNVPKYRNGTIVLTKYICSTPTYTSAVNCEIYEGGVTFTLLYRQNGNLTEVSDGKTGANGQLTWYGLDPGQYTVQEEGGPYCRITASQIDDGYIGVTDGTTTYVTVYNCKSTPSRRPGTSDPGKPRPSNAPPGKFPDTGVDPNAAVGPATGPIAGASSPSPESQIVRTSEAPSGSAEPSSCPVLSDPNETVSPSPSASESAVPSPSPSEQEVTAASLAPSPDAGVTSCDRGEVPANIVVDAVDMNLDIEVIETVDGVMQAPTGAEFASWYRETSRLGEEGPIVLAGHVNYWNVPEGPFYGLAQMVAGDIITVTGDDGGVYQYVVRSTEQFPSDASPNELFESVDQSAGGETMVLITCGGEWDPSISEYNERTVVVATRVVAGDESS